MLVDSNQNAVTLTVSSWITSRVLLVHPSDTILRVSGSGCLVFRYSSYGAYFGRLPELLRVEISVSVFLNPFSSYFVSSPSALLNLLFDIVVFSFRLSWAIARRR
jgi:hypothetical protein